MKRVALLIWVITLCWIGIVYAYACLRQPETTVLSLRVGQPFVEAVRESTYPLLEAEYGNPENYKDGNGWTYVTEPAVIIKFNDPVHGFVLPPTKFAAIGYVEKKVSTISTTPMLDKLPFDQAVALLENLQNQFKAGGWEPWEGDGSKWFDFSPAGKKELYATMFKYLAQSAELRVPNKYSITFRLWCASGCATREPPYLFLIDIGVGHDGHAWWDAESKSEQCRLKAAVMGTSPSRTPCKQD